MRKENASFQLEKSTFRLTRARAKASSQSGGLPPLHPTAKHADKMLLRSKFKRAAPDENKPLTSTAAPNKKRAVLKDVTNVIRENSHLNSANATKIQNLLRKHDKKVPLKGNSNTVPPILLEKPLVQEDKKEAINGRKNPMTEGKVRLTEPSKGHSSMQPSKLFEKSRPHEKDECSGRPGVVDIDSKYKDPLMCGVYAPAIYEYMNAMELDRRPSTDYMGKLQQDITEGMRGILIDWLVEVSEEYRLVPDTLYLTVNLIDRYLSGNYVEKQKLQLLGVTCMLIASKYEEICAPRAEEFCFITDNTYTKEEVVKIESRVLNCLGFQLSVPTSKKFLRRFIQAAQVSYKVPSVELEFLANYLGELTLLEYSFLKFLPSLIAASAVFLARWILDQSDHPWNSTLEHYTGYNLMDLKETVLALQDLQLNTSGCTLNAIREKYKQEKFKCVSSLSAAKPVQSLFTRLQV